MRESKGERQKQDERERGREREDSGDEANTMLFVEVP